MHEKAGEHDRASTRDIGEDCPRKCQPALVVILWRRQHHAHAQLASARAASKIEMPVLEVAFLVVSNRKVFEVVNVELEVRRIARREGAHQAIANPLRFR